MEDSRTAIVRLEQIYPFPSDRLSEVIAGYPAGGRILWVQEEGKNRGGWSFVAPLITNLAGGREVIYVGRNPSPSPATGSFREHKSELNDLLDAAFA